MMDHNYAGCQIELCEPCYHYAMGYSDGKAKGFPSEGLRVYSMHRVQGSAQDDG